MPDEMKEGISPFEQLVVDKARARAERERGNPEALERFVREHPVSGGSPEKRPPVEGPEGPPSPETLKKREEAEAAKRALIPSFLESIATTFEPEEIRKDTRHLLNTVEPLATISPDTWTETEILKAIARQIELLEIAQTDPKDAIRKGLDQFRLVDGVRPRLREMKVGTAERSAMVFDDEDASFLLATAKELAESQGRTFEMPENPGDKAQVFQKIAGEFGLSRKSQLLEPAVDLDTEEMRPYMAQFSPEDTEKLLGAPALNAFLQKPKEFKALYTPEQLEEKQKELMDLYNEVRVRYTAAVLSYYYYDRSYFSLKNLSQIEAVFTRITSLDWKAFFEFKPTLEGGAGLGELTQRALRYQTLVAMVGGWIGMDEADRESRELLDPDARSPWHEKLDDLLTKLPDKYKKMFKVVEKIHKINVRNPDFRFGTPEEKDPEILRAFVERELTDDEKKQELTQTDAWKKLTPEEQNYVELFRMSQKKVFNWPSSVATDMRTVKAWIEKMSTKEVADAEKEKKNRVDAKAANTLASRIFEMWGLLAQFDYSAGRGNIGAAVSSAMGEPMWAWSTWEYDTTQDRPRGPDIFVANPFIKLDSGEEFKLEHFMASFLHMQTTRFMIDEETRSFFELWMYGGMELNELPWERISNSAFWQATMEPFIYLIAENVGAYTAFVDGLERDRGEKFTKTLQKAVKSVKKGITHTLFTGGELKKTLTPEFIKKMKGLQDVAIKEWDRLSPEEKKMRRKQGKLLPNEKNWFQYQILEPMRWKVVECILTAMICYAYENDARKAFRETIGLWPAAVGTSQGSKDQAEIVRSDLNSAMQNAGLAEVWGKAKDRAWNYLSQERLVGGEVLPPLVKKG